MKTDPGPYLVKWSSHVYKKEAKFKILLIRTKFSSYYNLYKQCFVCILKVSKTVCFFLIAIG